MKAKLRVGDFQFESEQADFKAQMLELHNMRPRRKCDVCENTDKNKFDIRVRKVESEKGEFIYVEMVCFAPREDGEGLCWGKSNLGQYKDGSGFYWKEFVRFEGNENGKKSQ